MGSSKFLIDPSFYHELVLISFHFFFKVLMSLDRPFTLLSIRWKNNFKPKHAVFASLVCILVFTLLGDINLLLSYGEDRLINSTEATLCFSTGSSQTVWIDTFNLVRRIQVLTTYIT